MKAEITVKPMGTSRLHLDGHDVSNAVRSFTLDVQVGEVSRLELELAIFDASDITAADVHVVIPTATVELLRKLGWTPPNG